MKSKTVIDRDLKSFLDGNITNLIDGIELKQEELVTKKSEFFTQKFLKDSKGLNVINEPVHNIMHRFIRFAQSKGYNRYLCLGAFGHGKCLCKGSQVLMYDLSFKKIEDVRIGDFLMGPDGNSRKVLDIGQGKEQAYKITLKNKDVFKCNKSHKMPFYISNRWNGYEKGDIYIGTIEEYLNLPKWVQKNCWKIHKAQLDFEEQRVDFDPYIYGLWLGDGHVSGLAFTINDDDDEICEALAEWMDLNDFDIRVEEQESNCTRYDFSYGKRNCDPYFELTFVKSSVINGEKRIKKEYLKNSREIRLELLSGLIDTDGHLSSNCYEISTKWPGLRDDILFLCRSLGFHVSNRIKYVNDTSYYIIIISGYTDQIPCRVLRKQATERKQIKNPLVYGFDIEDIGNQEYYGIVLDDDHLYLQDDLTIHHNTEQLATGWVMHEIAKNPNLLCKIVHVSETEAVKRCRAIRDYISKDDDLHRIAPHLIPTAIWGSQRFIVKRSAMSKDGTVEAYGILSTAIGGRANLLVFDDPQDLKTAVLEPSTRQRIEDVFKNIWLTRLIPQDSQVLVLMNKWHNSDLASTIQRNPIWSWMSIAVNEDLTGLIYEDSFGRKKRVPLWSLFNEQDLKNKLRELGTRDFNRGYRLIPYTDHDKTFPSFRKCCHFHVRPDQVIEDERNWMFIGGIDFAGMKRPGTVLSVIAVHRKSGMKIPVAVDLLKGTQLLPQYMVKYFQKYGIDLYMAENNGVQDTLIDMLISMLGTEKFKRYGFKIEGFLTGRNKADPMHGLPAMEKEFENQEWMFCFDRGEPQIDDQDMNDPWLRMYYEFFNHPFYGTTDIVMSLWFAREGAKTFLRSDSDGPNIY